MSVRRDQKRRDREAKKAAKALAMKGNSGGTSKYARKKAWLRAHLVDGMQLWGFMVPSPKPWGSHG